MSFSWPIEINAHAPSSPQKFAPNPLTNVAAGDEVIWSNNDSHAHWPGLVNPDGSIDQKFFMLNQIAPHSSSTSFRPSTAGNLKYVCVLPGHQGETGTIQVS